MFPILTARRLPTHRPSRPYDSQHRAGDDPGAALYSAAEAARRPPRPPPRPLSPLATAGCQSRQAPPPPERLAPTPPPAGGGLTGPGGARRSRCLRGRLAATIGPAASVGSAATGKERGPPSAPCSAGGKSSVSPSSGERFCFSAPRPPARAGCGSPAFPPEAAGLTHPAPAAAWQVCGRRQPPCASSAAAGWVPRGRGVGGERPRGAAASGEQSAGGQRASPTGRVAACTGGAFNNGGCRTNA